MPDSSGDHVAAVVEQWRRERPDLDPAPMLVLGRIEWIQAAADVALRPLFAGVGLGNGDFTTLAALRRTGARYALSPGDLAAAMLVTSGAVTKRVDRLERQGLVQRDVVAADGRGRLVSLTAEGRRLVDRLIEAHLANEARLLADLTPTEQGQLADLLARLGATVGRVVSDQSRSGDPGY